MNVRVFGRPSTRPGTTAAFPKVRLVMLIEAGTHLIFDALTCPYRMEERVRALKLLRSVGPGMLLMWDRGLHSYANEVTEVILELLKNGFIDFPQKKLHRKNTSRTPYIFCILNTA